MNKTKLLTLAVIALFIINILTISFLFFKKGPRPNEGKRPRPREIVINKLGFDAQQIETYELLINDHKSNIGELDDKIKDAKNDLYQQLALLDNKKTTDSILNTLSKYKSQIEILHYNHFLDIKKLCKPEQLDSYNDLTMELAKIFAPKGMPKKDE
jgi:protein CpxP